jgi:hypothetical protein
MEKCKKEKSINKYFIAAIAAAALLLHLTSCSSMTTAPSPESAIASEPELRSFHNEAGEYQNLLRHFQSEVDEVSKLIIPENDIIDDDYCSKAEDDVLKTIDADIKIEDDDLKTVVEEEEEEEEEQYPVIIYETSSIVPDGFDKYAVIYHKFLTGAPGPNIAIIGGVHGSERAGMEAAQYLVDNFDFTSGNFLIIPKATATAPNSWGPGGHNLNRQFPGDSNGTAAQKVAAVITQLLDDFQPCVIIDMHEAFQDGFSNKILYWPNHEVTQEKLDAIAFVSDAINQTDLVGRHLGEYGGRNFGPARSKLVAGTTTQEYTLRYNIPAFTTETCMSNRLNVRVEQKVFIINALFEFFQNKHDVLLRVLEAQEKAVLLSHNGVDVKPVATIKLYY